MLLRNLIVTPMQIITLNNIKSEEEITVDFTKAYPAHYTKGKKWAKK